MSKKKKLTNLLNAINENKVKFIDENELINLNYNLNQPNDDENELINLNYNLNQPNDYIGISSRAICPEIIAEDYYPIETPIEIPHEIIIKRMMCRAIENTPINLLMERFNIEIERIDDETRYRILM